MDYRYSHVALGGTFDRLHLGHQHLLRTAFKAAEHVHIGLTQDLMVQTKDLSHLILAFKQRKNELESFLTSEHLIHRSSIIPLQDIYGTTLHDERIQAIIVTPHTLSGAEQINLKRAQLHLPSLPIIQTQLITDKAGDYLSSSKIRQGKVSRDGQVFAQLFQKDVSIAKSVRQTLSLPQGQLLHSSTQVKKIIDQTNTPIGLVGDFITQWFDDHQFDCNFAVVDGFNQRQPFQLKLTHWQPTNTFTAHNPAGSISTQAFDRIQTMIKSPTSLLTIEGEEDLCAIPLLLSLPLESHIFYGQPGAGIVIIKATETNKHKFAQLIQ